MQRCFLLVIFASLTLLLVGCHRTKRTYNIVEPQNRAPVAADMNIKVGAGASLITLSATDPDGDAITSYRINQPRNGVAVLTNKEKGTVSYTPDAGYEGSDSFAWWCADEPGDESNMGTVSITVIGNRGGSGLAPSAEFTWSSQDLKAEFNAVSSEGGTANSNGRVFATSELMFRWDTDNDGTWDKDWSTSPTADETYAANGRYQVKLQVRNPDGKIGSVLAEIEVRVGSRNGGGRVKKGDPGKGVFLSAKQAGAYQKNEATGIVGLLHGNYLVVGNARDTITFGSGVRAKTLKVPATSGEVPGWLFKAVYNSKDELLDLQTVSMGAKDRHVAYALTRTPNGYVLAGGFKGSIKKGTITLQSRGNFDLFVVRYNFKHEVIWAAQGGGGALTGEYDEIHDIAVDAKGRVWVTGTHQRNATFGSYKLTSSSSGNFLALYNSDGGVAWAKTISETAYWLAPTDTGCLVSGKKLQHYNASGNTTWTTAKEGGPVTWCSSDGSYAVIHPDDPRDNMLVMYKKDGTKAWNKPLGRGNWSIDHYGDNSIVAAGQLQLLQFDPKGEKMWEKPVFMKSRISVTEDGTVLLAAGLDQTTTINDRNNRLRPTALRDAAWARFK